MQTLLPTIEPVESHEPTVMVRLDPSTLSHDCLRVLLSYSEPVEVGASGIRGWLRAAVICERGRRVANNDPVSNVPAESSAWLLPWHQWDDQELSFALAASYSWQAACEFDEASAALDAIHRAVLTSACTRLGELHQAIQNAEARR